MRCAQINGADRMATDQQIEVVASMMFAAALAYTNTIGKKGWAWEACDEQSKRYWRNLAMLAWNVFNQRPSCDGPDKTLPR